MKLDIQPLQIGSLKIDPPVVLAPMAGYTDAAFRMLCCRTGCGATYTEMVSASGIAHHNPRTAAMLEADASERPVCAHLYGADPAMFAEAAQLVVKLNQFAFIDINCGCPVRKVIRQGAGSALMKHPEKIAAIVRAIREAVDLPVTVKTRTGLSPHRINIPEVAQAVAEAGAAAIAIHGRVVSHGHAGPSDWETIARVKAAVRIPVIGNGGVENAADAVRMFRETGVDAVMIGRAALGNPWIFEQVRDLLAGRPARTPTLDERKAMIFEHLEKSLRLNRWAATRRSRKGRNPEHLAVIDFRAHLLKYLTGLSNWADVRRGLNEMIRVEQVRAAVDQTFARESREAGRREERL